MTSKISTQKAKQLIQFNFVLFMIFSPESAKRAFKLEMHVKCNEIRTSTALVNIKAFKFMNMQSYITFGQCFAL